MKIEQIKLDTEDLILIESIIMSRMSYPNLKINDEDFDFNLVSSVDTAPKLSNKFNMNLSVGLHFSGSIDAEYYNRIIYSHYIHINIFDDDEGMELYHKTDTDIILMEDRIKKKIEEILYKEILGQ